MRADRLVAMTMLLQTRGKMTAAQLADKLSVSRRTILRDIEALSIAGVPIYAEGGHGGGIALDENYRTSLTGLKESELGTLFIATHTQRLRDLGIGDAAESAALKLLASIPNRHQSAVSHLRQRILIDPDWWFYDDTQIPLWNDILRAVNEDKCIEIMYENRSGEISQRILEPYSLVAKSSLWYLIAQRDGMFRNYRLARIQTVTVLAHHFERRADFDLPTYWREQMVHFSSEISGYTFTLDIAPQGLGFINRIVPGRYTFVDNSNATGWQRLRFQLESVELAKMLVFGLGNYAKVVEPEALQRAVRNAAQDILNSQ